MTVPKGKRLVIVSVAFAALSIAGAGAMAGPAGHPLTLRPMHAGPHGVRGMETLYHGPLRVLRRYRMVSAVECRSNADCASGEICCVVSGLETYCATEDECMGDPMKDDSRND